MCHPGSDRVALPRLAQMRIEEAERDTVRQFFTMLGDGGWSHSGASDGTDIFKLPGERIHRIMG